MRIKIVYDSLTAMTWAIRLVEEGDRYGLHDQLVHDRSEPLVEFYDPRYPFTDLGQFVARYNASTLLERPEASGLSLDGGTPNWTVSSNGMRQVHTWLHQQVLEVA